MEPIKVLLDRGDGAHFDEALNRTREAKSREIGGTLTFATKKNATSGGRTAVIITFDIERNGERIPVQAVTTANLLLMAASAVKATVEDEQ